MYNSFEIALQQRRQAARSVQDSVDAYNQRRSYRRQQAVPSVDEQEMDALNRSERVRQVRGHGIEE